MTGEGTGQIRGALQVGLVALAQRFLVLKWNSARQSTPTLQKAGSHLPSLASQSQNPNARLTTVE